MNEEYKYLVKYFQARCIFGNAERIFGGSITREVCVLHFF